MRIAPNGTLNIDAATSDRPIPSGVAPYSLTASARWLSLHAGDTKRIAWQVASADGVPLALGNPLNRVEAKVADPEVATIELHGSDAGTVAAHSAGQTTLTLTYQRQSSTGTYYDVTNGHRVVSVSIPIRVTP